MVAAKGWGGEGQLIFNGDRVSVRDNEKVLDADSSDGCATM